jgi:amino acid transporter
LLGLESAAVGTLITFGTAAIYVSFLMTAVAALVARSRRSWRPLVVRRGARLVNVLAVAWLAFETVNIAWPRKSIAPPGAPFYQVWAAPLSLAAIALLGLIYLATRRPRMGR